MCRPTIGCGDWRQCWIGLGCGRPNRAIGDHLYGSQDCLGYLQEHGVETVMPPRQGGNSYGGFEKQQFVYDASPDVYRCPGGHILQRRRTWKKTGKASYAGDPVVCGTCPLKSQCISAGSVSGVRQVTRFDTPYVDRAQAACASRHGRRLLQKRQTCIEGLFGQAKTFHGLRRARWRGLTHMHIQSLLTAMVLNVKQLLKSVARPGKSLCRRVLRYLYQFVYQQGLSFGFIQCREHLLSLFFIFRRTVPVWQQARKQV